jgi:hypothetical protein
MSSSIAFVRLPPLPDLPEPLRGTFVVHIRFSSLGTPEEAEHLLTPIREIAPTVLDTIAELPFRAAGAVHMDPPAPVSYLERATSLRDLPGEAVDALLAAVGPESGTQLGLVEILTHGGALNQPPAVPNAVSGRNAQWTVLGFGIGGPDQAPTFQAQLDVLIEVLAPWAQDELMINFLSAGLHTPRQVRASYGEERYGRLAAIKRYHDPRNLFRVNHNIVPA